PSPLPSLVRPYTTLFRSFFKLTQDLEHGGEVAHSDVIKAELQMQERRRQFLEAQLGLLNARLDLAVLIFPDFNENYEVADDLHRSEEHTSELQSPDHLVC